MALGTLPVTVTETDIDQAPGATHPVWFTFTTTALMYSVGVLAYAQSGALYRPKVFLYGGPASAPVLEPFAPTPGHDQAGVLPVSPFTTYYLKVEDDGFGTVFTAPLVLDVLPGPNLAMPTGSVLINDDTQGLRGLFLNPDTGTALAYRPFVAGEQGTTLPTGEIGLTADDEGEFNTLHIYSAQLAALATATLPASWRANVAFDATGFYMVSASGGNSTIYRITIGGVVTTVAGPIPGNINGIGVNRAGTILYYYTTGTTIRRWDLVNNVVLSNLVVDSGVTFNVEIVMLADDTIVVPWVSNANNLVYLIRRYSTAGATLNTYTVTYTSVPTDQIRVQPWSDDPVSLIAWSSFLVASVRTSILTHIRVSDGTVLFNPTVPVIEAGLGIAGTGQDTSMPRFGNSKSCPLIVLRAEASVPVQSGRRGIYVPTRGVAGSEGGGANARFSDLGGAIQSGPATGTSAGRIIHVPLEGGLGNGRAIYVPPNAEGNTPDGRQRIMAVPIGTEGYSHR